jgi:hypothetical protein
LLLSNTPRFLPGQTKNAKKKPLGVACAGAYSVGITKGEYHEKYGVCFDALIAGAGKPEFFDYPSTFYRFNRPHYCGGYLQQGF